MNFACRRHDILITPHKHIYDSVGPHELQYTRIPCPSLSPWVCSDTYTLNSVIPSNHLIFCCPLLLLSCFPCIKVFSFQSTLCIRWPKYWSFCSRSCSECSGLISFRIDFFDLLAIQWTLKSLLQHFQWKPSTLQRPAFFMVPTVTSIRDYWNNWIFDYTDLCQQNGSSAF